MKKSSVNTFSGGMNKDTAKTVQTKNTYIDAKNVRLNTDNEGQTVGGMVNIKGNDFSFNFPPICNVYTFKINAVTSLTVNITIDGNSENFNLIGTDNEQLLEDLVAQMNLNPTFNGLGIVASRFDCDRIYVTSTTLFSIVVTSSSVEITDITEIIPVINDTQIIGSTSIRDTIILFTTNDTTTVGGAGQIWRLEIDPVTNTPTLVLIYNNLINFSIEYPIQAVGRYENSCTEKVYWTDNFNLVRKINVLGDNTFGQTLDQLQLNPLVDHSLPILQNILTGGDILTGVYQFAYRLTSTGGGETTFSLPSNLINITSLAEDPYHESIGSDSELTVAKSICIQIENLDTDYDFVEVVSIYRKDEISPPIIQSFLLEPVPGDGTLEFCYSGTENNIIDITEGQFNAISGAFTHCKTLASKDNRLFAGNVRNELISLGLDTRAYGFDRLNDNQFSVDGSIIDLGAGGAFTDVLEEDNAINDDPSTYMFQQGGSVYGGTGPNISYEIKTFEMLADEKPIGFSTSPYDNNPGRFLFSNPSNITLGNNTYPSFAEYQGMRSPNMFGLLKGYQRDETYRFAIIFYDKQGNAGFANWIADIKIPKCMDPTRAVYGTDRYVNGNFNGKLIDPIGLPGSATQWNLNIPYIQFNVTLPTDVQEKVSGYTIVRVERDESNRTIKGQGLAHLVSRKFTIDDTPNVRTSIEDIEAGTYRFIGDNGIVPLLPSQFDGNYIRTAAVDNAILSTAPDGTWITVDMPEHLYNDSISHQTGDTIRTVDVLSYGLGGSNTVDQNFKLDPGTEDYGFQLVKYYTPISSDGPVIYNTNLEEDVEEFYRVGAASTQTLDDGSIFMNENFNIHEENTANFPRYAGYGAKTLLIRTDSAMYTDLEVLTGGLNTATFRDTAYIVNYYRTLTNQYGGNTFSQRSNNIYISTGNYVDIDCNTPALQSFEVFGGDISMGVQEEQKKYKIWQYSGTLSATHTKSATFKWWPVESTINVDLRQGSFFDNVGINDNGTGTDLGEDFLYNNTWSVEDTLKKFFPKPVNFSDKEEFDTRVYASEPKINGEVVDSWSDFPINQFLDVEGLYGPINNLSIFNDSMIFHQDCGFGVISVNPRSLVQDAGGFNLELGSGGVLHDHTYVSTKVGSKHQWGIITAKNAMYWLDINTKKFYRFTGQETNPLSDIKGMFSYFCENLQGDLNISEINGGDNPLIGKGINGYYDEKNNEVVFTFHGRKNVIPFVDTASYGVGDIVEYLLDTYTIHTPFVYSFGGDPVALLAANATLIPEYKNNYTVAFSEFVDGFTSFYDFEAPIYVQHKDIILSPNPDSRVNIFRHNVGSFGEFYNTVFPWSLKYISNDVPIATKTFDNISFHLEVTDSLGDVKDDTFDTVLHNTDYQTTGNIVLDPLIIKNIKRRERTWNMDVQRSTTNRERMRDKYMESEFSFDNTANNRAVLHYMNNLFRVSHR